jgi:ATP-dependent DNA helicase RecG
MTYQRYLHPLPTDPDVRYDDRDFITVNLIEAYQRLMTFIRRNLPDKFHLEDIQRVDIRNVIFREIAANMLIHREFSHSFPAKFLIFSDRVITENWTKPIGKSPITLENLETHPKNPNIAHVFREMGWGEQLGSGRKNIMKYAPYYYNKYKITIENEEKFVFEITYRDIPEKEQGLTDQAGTKQDSSRYQAGLKGTREQGNKELRAQGYKDTRIQAKEAKEKQILDFCLISRDMKEIMIHLGHRNRQKFRNYYINPLLEKGLLSMTFPDNPTHQEQKYVTTEKGREI